VFKLNQVLTLFLVGIFSTVIWSHLTWIAAVFSPATAQDSPTLQSSVFGLVTDPEPFIPDGLRQSNNPSEGSRGVIGLDDRVPMTSRSYPWSAIGRLESPVAENTVFICTGSLVASDVVLTNAHCIIDPETHQPRLDTRFKPNLVNGRLQDEADVATVIAYIEGTDFQGNNAVLHPDDWAFLKLDKPLGEKYGTISWASLSLADLIGNPEQYIMVGYSGDFPDNNPGATASAHVGCSILGDTEEEVLRHNCDTFGGSSGGPILALIDDEFRIVALNVAEGLAERVIENTEQVVQTGIVNYGIKVSRFVDFIAQNSNR
jgi:V8-like Glu-specific endopeptidase